ncbi:MAG: di-trans,poly-cis-decaprenylcistransferase [Bacteroidales bacterium]|nr:di-trans,poly-cis-decaprenylcistransferase [Bacteroidales bacterium]
MNSKPQHIAIIMDGNGRWATAQGKPRSEGHIAGAATVRRITEAAREEGIRYLTLYAFSSENWNRPTEEVNMLMSLLVQHLSSELSLLLKHGIRLRTIGNIETLSDYALAALNDTLEKTAHCENMDLVLALSYGSRDEITRAVRLIAATDIKDITEKTISEHLDTSFMPDPDLLIRTSGEQRLSNFLLWQMAYTEFYISPILWPDFSKEDFRNALSDYAKRNRRYGNI